MELGGNVRSPGDRSAETGVSGLRWRSRLSIPFALKLRLAGSAAVYAVLFAAVGVLLAATLPAFRGFHTVTVYGGSMGESLPAGSVAVTQPVDAQALRVGDVIAIGGRRDGLPVLHRIVAIDDTDGQRVVTTRGDANETNDPQPITVEGRGDRVVYHIPWIGYFLAFARTQLGLAMLVGLPGTAWVIVQILSAWRSRARRASPSPS